MKINIFLLCVIIGSITLSCEPKLTAETIVKNSLEEAHGGKKHWETYKTLVYEKTTILYDSLGTIESQKKQRFKNNLQPEFTSEVNWEADGINKRVVFDGKEIRMFSDQKELTDAKVLEKAYKEIIGAQYVLWQPYKLLADEASLKLEGKVLLEDGSETFKIKVTYPNTATQWWYYFDTKTWLLKENLVKHGTTYSQIKNIKHEVKTGLYLNKERKSFMIDSLNNQKHLRAHYYYTILRLE